MPITGIGGLDATRRRVRVKCIAADNGTPDSDIVRVRVISAEGGPAPSSSSAVIHPPVICSVNVTVRDATVVPSSYVRLASAYQMMPPLRITCDRMTSVGTDDDPVLPGEIALSAKMNAAQDPSRDATIEGVVWAVARAVFAAFAPAPIGQLVFSPR